MVGVGAEEDLSVLESREARLWSATSVDRVGCQRNPSLRTSVTEVMSRELEVQSDQNGERLPDQGPSVGARLRDADHQLVQRLLAGDEGAFEWLVGELQGALIRLARSFVQRPGAAEEVVQDTWLGVLRGLPAFEGRSSLKTWIFRILVNRARTRAVRDGRSVLFSELDGPGEGSTPVVDAARFRPNGRWQQPPEPWDVHTPEGLLLRGEAVAALRAAIEVLPPAQRTVVVLRDIEGMSSGEVCNILQISETNQRVLLHRGRSRLRRALEDALGKRAQP